MVGLTGPCAAWGNAPTILRQGLSLMVALISIWKVAWQSKYTNVKGILCEVAFDGGSALLICQSVSGESEYELAFRFSW